MMKNEELNVAIADEKNQELIREDEFVPDYSFLYKIRQLNLKLNETDENYGFCLDS